MVGIRQLRTVEQMAARRGIGVPQVFGLKGGGSARKAAAAAADADAANETTTATAPATDASAGETTSDA